MMAFASNRVEVMSIQEFMNRKNQDFGFMIEEAFEIKKMTRKEAKKLKKFAVWLWGVSGIMLTKTPALAASTLSSETSLWSGMQQIFGVFQEIGMTLGAFAILSGLIVMIFKRRVATKIIVTAAIAVGAVFLVPSAIMLVAIIGSMLNDALTTVFTNMQLKESVEVIK